LQQQRLTQAHEVLGEKVVGNLLCFALYLLGVDRSSLADMMDLPAGTFRSIIRAALHHGLPALEDLRRSASTFLPPQQRALGINVRSQEQKVCVDFETMGSIKIPGKKSLQIRVVLLTMLYQGLLSSREVSRLLGLSRPIR